MHTTVTFDYHDQPATVSFFRDLGHALYRFGDAGKVHVQPAYFGQPDRLAVTISLGRPGDQSGWSLTGLDVGDWYVTGVVMCTGGDFTPYRHPHSPDQFPLTDIDVADARDQIAGLLSQIAQHFYDSVN